MNEAPTAVMQIGHSAIIRRLDLKADPDADLSVFFNASWLLNAYNEVASKKM